MRAISNSGRNECSGNGAGKEFRKKKLMAALAVGATGIATAYYVVGLSDRMTGNKPNLAAPFVPVPATVPEPEDFDSISSLTVKDARWIGRAWVEHANGSVAFHVESSGLDPAIVVTGLGFGPVKWFPEEVSESGLIYRGRAVCMDHGGTIDGAATLTLQPDNRLLLKVANKKVILVAAGANPNSGTSAAANGESVN